MSKSDKNGHRHWNITFPRYSVTMSYSGRTTTRESPSEVIPLLRMINVNGRRKSYTFWQDGKSSWGTDKIVRANNKSSVVLIQVRPRTWSNTNGKWIDGGDTCGVGATDPRKQVMFISIKIQNHKSVKDEGVHSSYLKLNELHWMHATRDWKSNQTRKVATFYW